MKPKTPKRHKVLTRQTVAVPLVEGGQPKVIKSHYEQLTKAEIAALRQRAERALDPIIDLIVEAIVREIGGEQSAPAAKRTLLKETDAAKYIGMSVAFLQAGRCRGTIGKRTPTPPFMKLGRMVRYDIVDLNAWLSERRITRNGKA